MPEIPTVWSLVTIVGILTIAVVASLIKVKRDEAQGAIALKWNKDYDDIPMNGAEADGTPARPKNPSTSNASADGNPRET